jgi:hypothetical protein
MKLHISRGLTGELLESSRFLPLMEIRKAVLVEGHVRLKPLYE